MKCKYFIMHKACVSCEAKQNNECPKPETKYFKSNEWWEENRTDDMISYFEKLEVQECDIQKEKASS